MVAPVNRLGDLCDLVAEQVDPRESPTLAYLGLEHLSPGRFLPDGEGIAGNTQSAKYAFRSGDVLYGKLRPYLDKAVLARMNGLCTTELLVLRPKLGVDPRFMLCVLHSPQLVEHAVAGTTGVQHPRTSWGHIAEFEIPGFTSREQITVAGLLWKVHSVTAANQSVLIVATQLKRAAMRELFTRGLRGETRKETEIGLVPESWALVPCSEIFKLSSGAKRPADLSDSPSDRAQYPVVGGNGIMGFSANWFVEAGRTLVIGRVGEYCGAVHVMHGKIWVTDNALYAREWLRTNAYLDYVAAFLDHFDLNRFKRMAGQPLVTQGLINEAVIPLPDIAEQREIVRILESIAQKIELHRRKRDVLNELFKALLHKLMTGEVRVSDLDLTALDGGLPTERAA